MQAAGDLTWGRYDPDFNITYVPDDNHPISRLIQDANERWRRYEEKRSQNFRQAVATYREKYGRHPPPGFKEWYKFARERHVYNIDDFDQIMDDLRPFWAVEPKLIRQMAARLPELEADGIAGVHIRNKRVAKVTHPGWRPETFAASIKPFVKYLPDMDIAMNKLDQPRLVVPFEQLQTMLAAEAGSRQLYADAKDVFTENMNYLHDLNKQAVGEGGEEAAAADWDPQTDPEWFSHAGKQYMEIAEWACPPGSPARNQNLTVQDADELYKTEIGGFVSNFNLSTDLCTVGPTIQRQHGFLYSASSILASKRLVPVFSECKVSVNNDILFPANMYALRDERYVYESKFDYDWEDKADSLVWRGVTSGGVQLEDNWQTMHRQRLVMLANDSLPASADVTIMAERAPGIYEVQTHFNASAFAARHFDVGFVEAWGCIPGDCAFYRDVWTYKASIPLGQQFKAKYLVDVDGHSFSGRWRAFHFSKSLGFKATIFREWHDSRLFAWRHFIPLDNRYDDLYSLMTYFIGVGRASTLDRDDSAEADLDGGPADQTVYVRRHEHEAKMVAAQSREWAHKVLRDEDLQIYTFRLLLEYARLSDDNRDLIGYSGDGSELDQFDAEHPMPEPYYLGR